MNANGARVFVRAVCTAWLLGHAAAPHPSDAAAGRWKPEQTVEIIIATSPGTGSDATGRWIQHLLREKKLIDVSTAVVNKPGGATALATTYLNKHPGNGHYVMMATLSFLASHITGASEFTYTDTTPLAQIGTESVVTVVRADSRFKSAKELADALRANPAGVTVAFANALGNQNHIAAAQVAKSVGANVKQMKVVVFNGSGESVTALLGGHVDVITISASPILKYMTAGKVRILAVSAEQRLAGVLAAVPTWKELGIASVSSNWRNMVGPRGMTEGQIAYWDDVFAKLVQLPEWKQDFEKKVIENTYLNARETKKLMETQYAELSKLLAELGLAK